MIRTGEVRSDLLIIKFMPADATKLGDQFFFTRINKLLLIVFLNMKFVKIK